MVEQEDREAVIRWLRAIGDASHRLANELAGVPVPSAEPPPAVVPVERKLTKTEHYYARQAQFLGAIIDRGGKVSLDEGRRLARDAGITKGWQVYWRPAKNGGGSLLERDGDTLKVTTKGRKRHAFATKYVQGGEAA